MKLGLISCTKSKQIYPCPAGEMYQPSALFRKAYSYARKHYDQIGILSAKYGFLLPDEKIEPYDLTLKNMGVRAKREWAQRVMRQIEEKLDIDEIDSVYIHAGKDYREYLVPLLKGRASVYVPLKGLSFGQQLQWYDKHCCSDSE